MINLLNIHQSKVFFVIFFEISAIMDIAPNVIFRIIIQNQPSLTRNSGIKCIKIV